MEFRVKGMKRQRIGMRLRYAYAKNEKDIILEFL